MTKPNRVLDELTDRLGADTYRFRTYMDSQERRIMLVDVLPSTDMEALAAFLMDVTHGLDIRVISRWPFATGNRIVITWVHV